MAAYAALAISFVAALGALVGGALVALITTKRDSERQMRDKMLQVADDFLTASTGVLSSLRALDPTGRDIELGWRRAIVGRLTVESTGEQEILPMDAAKELQGSINEASRQLARVRLLFFPHSRAATNAADAVENLEGAWQCLQAQVVLRRASETDDLETKRQVLERGAANMAELSFAAVASQLSPDLLGAAPVVGELLGGALVRLADPTSLKDEMKHASEAARSAQDQAQRALNEFTVNASMQALEQPRWRLRGYTVLPSEQVVVSYEPKHPRAAWMWRGTASEPASASAPAHERE